MDCGCSATTPFLLACKEGQAAAAKLLLDSGCSVQSTNIATGCSALHLATQCGSEDIVLTLLERHALKVDKRNYRSETALHIASYYNHEDLV